MSRGENGPSTLAARLLREQDDWQSIAVRKLGNDATLYYISPLDGDRRLYRYGDRIAKIQRSWNGEARHPQSLLAESGIMRHLDRTSAFQRGPTYEREGDWELLSYRFQQGVSFAHTWERSGVQRRLSLLLQAAREVLRISGAGIAHGDIVFNNMIVDGTGAVHLLDFGDARIMESRIALFSSFSKATFGRHGLLVKSARLATLRIFPPAQRLYRSFKLRRIRPFSIDAGNDADLARLAAAWRHLARWNNEANEWLSYSSLSVDGIQFPGRRAWLLRWTPISKSVSFRGKRVLDLGASSGLLCSFALLAGAEEAHGVDADPKSVDGARELAKALGVPATFELLDLDSPEPWEDRTLTADLVSALSVLEWVSDRERLLKFIARHSELLYEGHDPIHIELERLHSAGFREIELITLSDRARPLFYAKKANPTKSASTRIGCTSPGASMPHCSKSIDNDGVT